VVVLDGVDDATGGDDQLVDDPVGTDTTGTGTSPGAAGGDPAAVTDDPVLRPAAGQVRVNGTITALHLEGALPEPRLVSTPLTLVSERGFGNGGEVTGVQISGRDSEVVWDGGRPFLLSSGPGLELDPVEVDLVPEGLRLALGGGIHAFAPGEYRLNTPVAVGSAGIATAQDAVTFEAGTDALLAASGDTALVLGPTGPHRLVGPGLVHLEGDLTILDEDGTSRVTSLDLADGVFDLVLTPTPTGWTVSGTCAAA